MSDWKRLSFLDVKKGMLVKDAKMVTSVAGIVKDVADGVIYVETNSDDKTEPYMVVFPSEVDDFEFMSPPDEYKSKEKLKTVLSKEEIYEMLLSDPLLYGLSMKAVRKVEKLILNKLEENKLLVD